VRYLAIAFVLRQAPAPWLRSECIAQWSWSF
jgi:hypothetical protein